MKYVHKVNSLRAFHCALMMNLKEFFESLKLSDLPDVYINKGTSILGNCKNKYF